MRSSVPYGFTHLHVTRETQTDTMLLITCNVYLTEISQSETSKNVTAREKMIKTQTMRGKEKNL